MGVSWRSTDLAGDRAPQCTKLVQWGAILRVAGVHFVNVQYDECEAELSEAEAAHGVKIQRYPEVDMFNDLDETAALMRGLDLVITAPTSVSILSAALGVLRGRCIMGCSGNVMACRTTRGIRRCATTRGGGTRRGRWCWNALRRGSRNW